MLRSDLPAFPSFSAAMPAAPGVAAAAGIATHGTAVQQALAYTPLGNEVAREVQQFIQQGGGAAAGLASPQAQWMALQATRQLQQQAKASESAASAAQRPAFATGGAAFKGHGTAPAAESAPTKPTPLKPEQQAFLQRIGPWAHKAASALGVSVRSVMAHAALESGWGQRPLRTADGRDALNLFGFKAMGGWQGASLQALTTEFVGGQAVQQTESFREYADLDATFADYVRLLGHSPRYSKVRNTGEDVQAFASALSQGGYASDPAYVEKLVRISRSIPAAP